MGGLQLEDRLSQLLVSIQEATLDPSRFFAMLETYRSLLDIQAVEIGRVDPIDRSVLFMTDVGLPPEIVEPYFNHYQYINPRLELATLPTAKTGAIIDDRFIRARGEESGREFYAWVDELELGCISTSTVTLSPRTVQHVTLHHPPGVDPRQDQLKLMAAVQSQLNQALEIMFDVQKLQLESRSLDTVLADLNIGVIVLGQGGRCLFANKLAEQLFDAHFLGLDRSSRLVALNPHARPIEALAGVASDGREAVANRSQSLSCSSHKGRMRVTSLPLTSTREMMDFHPRAQAVLYLQYDTATTHEGIAERYQLTPREIEIAQRFAVGRRPKLIADELDLSVATVRTHLRNIYRKTDVQSQAQLLLKLRGED